MPPRFVLQAATADDFEDLLALRLRAMRPSLERLGRYDEPRIRDDLARSFDPTQMQHIVVDGRRVGFVSLKTLSQVMRLNHLYIEPAEQEHGYGHEVLGWIIEQADRAQLPVELCALKGSDAVRFYLRHGFALTGEGEWDYDFVRTPPSAGVRAVRGWWQALQARDWQRARSLLRDDLHAVWWASGERFDGAAGFVEVQARYPQGWTIQLIEVSALQDGRVVSVARIDQPPQTFFATSFFHLEDGLIFAVDEYWATAEEPPAWRPLAGLAGWQRIRREDDPRAQIP
ncbi:MAG: GNAT family N-acetyltransferase [Rubrivivax sp.]|nr:GNAT family N-acetyltransferase [Rubrivivax sp.]